METFTFESGGLELPAWGASPHGRPTLVLCHGLGSLDISDELIWALSRLGFGALLFRYRGVLPGPGDYSFKGNEQDISNAIAAVKRRGWLEHGLGLLGYSLGGFHAVRITASGEAPVRFLVLMAPLVDTRKLVEHIEQDYHTTFGEVLHSYKGALRGDPELWLEEEKGFRGDEQPLSLASRISVPLLLLHGKHDNNIPVDHMLLLKDAWRSPCKLVTFDTDHEFKSQESRVASEVDGFVREQHIA